MSTKWTGILDLDFSSLYPSQMINPVKMDLVKINREITIRNIINDTDTPLVKNEREAILHEMLMGRIKNKEDE